MDWTAVATILATGVVSLGSVSLKTHYDNRVELRRLQAEREDAASRLLREEQLSARDDQRNEVERRTARAEAVIAELAAVLDRLAVVVDEASAKDFETAWNEQDAHARRVAERVYRAELRDIFAPMMDCLTDLNLYCSINEIPRMAYQGKVLVRMMIELAGCEARGDKPSADLSERLKTFDERFARYETAD